MTLHLPCLILTHLPMGLHLWEIYVLLLMLKFPISAAMCTIDSFACGIAPLGDNVLLMLKFPISAAMFTIDSFACGIAPLGDNVL